MGSHYWISADRRADRDRLRAGIDLPPLLARVEAHRRLRGPYTAAGAVLRAIGADALARCPELGPRHHIEILTAAPEFEGAVPPIESTLEQESESGARTRYQARLHTLRLAHGLAEFLRDYLTALGDGPRTLVLEDVQEADPTDHEFVAVLLQRLSPSQLTVVVGTAAGPPAEAPGPVSISLPETLRERTVRVDEPAGPGAPGDPADAEGSGSGGSLVEGLDEATLGGLARAYVATECTGDDPRQRAAYQSLSAADRAALHDERRLALLARGERSLLLGAVPYHAEQGGDPAGAGAAALREAQLYCKNLGLYHAAAELGERGRAVVDRASRPELWWDLTGDVTTSLSAIGRAEEAEARYDEARAISTDPLIHMHAAYGTAMLFARHYGDQRRDAKQARRWLNQAVAIASLLPDPKERAFYSVFHRNGIALVETREGRPEEALRLLNEGMARLDRELEPGEQLLHRTGLRYNRAQVYGMSGRLEEALADYSSVIEVDPNFHDHYFNRGNVLRRLGRNKEAIEDYERALRLSPPFPEAYYNRGDARLELGDVDGALADFDRVLELDPEHVDARLNRAALRCDLDDVDGAWADVTAGLAYAPENPHLLCVKGRILVERGEAAAAREVLTAALGIDDGLAEAWAIRGGLGYESGDLVAAISDLSRAVELLGTPEIRYNRAMVYQAAGRFAEAAADYRAVLEVTDDVDATARLADCLRATSTSAAV
ncbi:tetratricopeptide repeat protein [Micromonospora sp. NPDC093277]|uniref:tetratricopeptide repeat protein n=1 Tax=Micromonospora sp. NPDC093277 TaxID=3364291 RepID=UPI00381A6BD2